MRCCVIALVALGACTVPAGQRVRALLQDEVLTCQDVEGVNLATLRLEQAEDLYVAEFAVGDSGKHQVLGAERDGLDVTFVCPEGLDTLLVRRISVLQAKQDNDPATEPTSPQPP